MEPFVHVRRCTTREVRAGVLEASARVFLARPLEVFFHGLTGLVFFDAGFI